MMNWEESDAYENYAAAGAQTLDERGLSEFESTLEGEDAGRQNLEGNEADSRGASTEGIAPGNWVRAPTLTSDHAAGFSRICLAPTCSRGVVPRTRSV